MGRAPFECLMKAKFLIKKYKVWLGILVESLYEGYILKGKLFILGNENKQ